MFVLIRIRMKFDFFKVILFSWKSVFIFKIQFKII